VPDGRGQTRQPHPKSRLSCWNQSCRM